MSTKKATPRKKRAPKPKTASPVVSKDNATLEREDLLLLKLAYSELQNKQLELTAANMRLEESKVNWDKHVDRVNKKYGLTPGKDTINLGTGLIQKG